MISRHWSRSSSVSASSLSAGQTSLELAEEPQTNRLLLEVLFDEDQTLRRNPPLRLRQLPAEVSRRTVGSSRAPEYRLIGDQVSSAADLPTAFVVEVVGEVVWRWRSASSKASCWRPRWWRTVGPANKGPCSVPRDDRSSARTCWSRRARFVSSRFCCSTGFVTIGTTRRKVCRRRCCCCCCCKEMTFHVWPDSDSFEASERRVLLWPVEIRNRERREIPAKRPGRSKIIILCWNKRLNLWTTIYFILLYFAFLDRWLLHLGERGSLFGELHFNLYFFLQFSAI